jgi:hypothetical protein
MLCLRGTKNFVLTVYFLFFFAEKVVSDLSESWATYPSVSAAFIHLPLKMFPGSLVRLVSAFLIVYFHPVDMLNPIDMRSRNFSQYEFCFNHFNMSLSSLWFVKAYFVVLLIDVIATALILILSLSFVFQHSCSYRSIDIFKIL